VKKIATKVKELELDKFVEMVLESDEDVAKQVQEANLDAKAIIGKHKSHIDKYGVSTGTAFAIARLREAILEYNSESVKGLLVGDRDRFGTSAPLRIPIIRSNGEHVEVISWTPTVKLGDSKVELEFPSVAELRILYDGEFKGVPNIRLISAEKLERISVPDAILRLGKVAKDVGEIDGGDELAVVVVRGKIAYVEPATRWKNKEKDGSWQIWVPNQKDEPVNHPVMQISLEAEDGNRVRVILERQNKAVPTIMVEDFVSLAEDAVKDSTDPGEQARFFGECMRGREVIVVGFMTKFTSGTDVNYVDVNAYAIFDASAVKQTTVSKAKAEDDEASDDPEDEPEKKPAKSAKEPAKSAKKSAGKAGAITADALKDKIRAYCEVLGIEPKDLSAEKAMELAPGKSKGFVETILEEVQSEA
jgi:hypothetical protein